MAMFAIGVAAATAQVATMNLSGSVPAELNGKKMYIINLDTRERIDSAVVKNGKEARSEWRVLHKGQGYSLLGVRSFTGRTHQIRVHLAHLGHPLLGDDLYGGSLTRIKRQALHAARLRFRHPLTNEMIDVRSPLPSDMEQIVSDFHHPKR